MSSLCTLGQLVSARVLRFSGSQVAGAKRTRRLIVAATPAINQMCDKVMATPAVGPVAKPAIDSLRAKHDALAKV